jgi:glycolate oxidase FAD binding subunit
LQSVSDRILEHEAGDLTCTVEAGIRLSALRSELAEHGQMLALDPPGDPTIGACIVDDLHGPRSYRYGRMRDLLLGVTVELEDGLVSNSGGKVVKNVAGYDLGKLFCGSRGTLGVVTRASLRLHPLPDATATLVSAGDGEAKARVIRRSQLVPSALDVTAERLAVMFEGAAAAVEFQLEAARELVGGSPASDEVWEEVRARPRAVPQPEGALAALHERIRLSLAGQ